MVRKNLIEYPIDALTPIFHYAGKDTHTATQAPNALIALVLLSSAAAVCQRLIDVVLPVANGLLSPASLYLMFIGESGERRSAVNSLSRHRYTHTTKRSPESRMSTRTFIGPSSKSGS